MTVHEMRQSGDWRSRVSQLPQAPLKPCNFQGCSALVRSPHHGGQAARFCDAHRGAAEGLDRRRRGSSAERGYDDRWREFRRSFLRTYPLCGMRPAGAEGRIQLGGIEWSECKRAHLICAADLVDHIEPHRGDQILFWDATNHQALCFSCGNAKSGKGM
jgi:5-methylcytosine-specific restriction protein A